MATQILMKNVDEFNTLSEIIDDLIDEEKYPTIRLIEPPLLSPHIIPIIVRARLNLLKAWKRYTDEKISEDVVVEEILSYAAFILSIATDIRNGDYTSRALLSPDSTVSCQEICQKIGDNLHGTGIDFVASKQWRMGTKNIFFGDVVNIEGLTLYWRSNGSIFSRKISLKQLIPSDDMKGEV